MSDLILPPEGLVLPPGVNKPAEAIKDEERSAKQLPTPSGYKMLIALPDVEETYGEGIIAKASTTMQAEEITTVVGFVLKMGSDCYKDTTRFPSGPWCKVGDFILARPNTGTRLKIHGREFRIINDDSVEGTVLDPRGISRV